MFSQVVLPHLTFISFVFVWFGGRDRTFTAAIQSRASYGWNTPVNSRCGRTRTITRGLMRPCFPLERSGKSAATRIAKTGCLATPP